MLLTATNSNYEAYRTIRAITGLGATNGPYVSYHDSFLPLTTWVGSLTGADRVVLDSHPYFAFDSPAATDSIDTGTGPTAGGPWPGRACERWAGQFNTR
jgi:glucan 1,3-beta-glucosidase